MLATISTAWAEGAGPENAPFGCCLGDDNGSQLNATGLGMRQPSAVDLSLDPAWEIYGFQRDGIVYYQINDLEGRVQLIIGALDGVFWALPAGEVSTPVALPPQRVSPPQRAERTEAYRDPAFSLVSYRTGETTLWSVEVPGSVP
jgi:hypothetical protein